MFDTNVCRLCLQGSGPLYNIVDSGLQLTLEKVTQIVLNNMDGYPQAVCFICRAYLRKCEKLINMSTRSEKLLNNIINNQLSHMTIDSEWSIQDRLCTMVVSEPEIVSLDSTFFPAPEQCDLFDMSFEACDESELDNDTKVDILQANIQAELRSQPAVEQQYLHGVVARCGTSGQCVCDYCKQVFYDKKLLEQHITTCKIEQQGITNKHRRILNKNKYKCNFCDEGFNIKRDFNRHIRSHTRKPKRNRDKGSKQSDQPKCEATRSAASGNKTELARGLSRTFPGLKPYKCDLCDKAFDREGHLKTHVRTHTGERPYMCDLCDKRFNREDNLKTHLRTHTGEKPYWCDVCDKRFNHEGNLTTHLRTHTGEKPYRCDICDKRFNTKAYMKKHAATHSGEKPYRCDICDKRFGQEINLRTHLRTHTGEKPYRCDICGKRFQQNVLKTHMRIHTGEKPYRCDVCDKRFNQKGSLKKHLKVHTGVSPYRCDVCGEICIQQSVLIAHMKTHTHMGENSYW